MMRILTVIFFSTWKFAATFPFAIMVLQMTWIDTLLYTNIGGLAGIIIFGLFSKFIMLLYDKYWPDQLKKPNKTRKVFSQRKRRLVKIKNKYGLPAIVLLSPVLLSIPVGSFLITKYYGDHFMSYFWQLTGQVLWSLVYVLVYIQFSALIL